MISQNPEDLPPRIPPHKSTVSIALRRIAQFCVSRLPKDWGFVILAFPFDNSEGLRYVSNGTRKDVLKLLKQYVDANSPTKAKIPPETGPGSGPGDCSLS